MTSSTLELLRRETKPGRFQQHFFEEFILNKDTVDGNWMQFKGKVQEQWGKLTNDDLDVIAGKRDQLLGKIKERHGITHEEAEKQISDWHGKNPTNFFERY